MSPLYVFTIILFLAAFSAALFYMVLSRITLRKRAREKIVRIFHAKEFGDALRFTYSGYDVIATVRGRVRLSILHEKELENRLKAPKGMKLTPLYLIVEIKGKENMRKKLDEAIAFLENL